jgi:predicted DNA-binding transcriptional regulator YafY
MKTAQRPRAYRIRRIVEMIRADNKQGRFPSASVFAAELEVTWRTIINDLEYLRDEEGAPIEYDASRKGYFMADGGWSLKPVTLNQREVFAFSMAGKLIQPFRGTPLEMDLTSLFSKIGRSLEGTVTLSADALTEHFSVVSDDYVPLDPEKWITAAGHIERRELVRVRYRTFSGENKSRVVFPFHLVAYHGNWYVLACIPEKENPISLALSRIAAMTPTGKTGNIPHGFDLPAYMKSAFGISRGEKEIKVRLLFTRNVATYISERQWHPTQRVIHRKNGSVELRVTTRGWKELVRWILSWQPDVKVLAPIILRERVNEKLKMGLRMNA